MSRIKREIDSVSKRRARQREGRRKSPVPTVSLVGYTSAGKSTLFNALAGENRYTSPHLFATLDPMVRRVTLPDGSYFFLSDTVGFIKKLPVELISSFRATLEEIREADCLLEVIDITSPGALEQAEAAEEILSRLEVTGIPLIKVFNKIDLLPEEEKKSLLERQPQEEASPVYVSARSGEGLENLKARLRQVIFKNSQIYHLHIPKERMDLTASLVRQLLVIRKTETAEGWEYQVLTQRNKLFPYLPYLRKGEIL